MHKNKRLYALLSLVILASSVYLGCSSSSTSSSSSTGTFKGTITSFTTAALKTEKKSMFAQIKDFLFPKAHAIISFCCTVTIGDVEMTVNLFEQFSSPVPTGDQIVTYTVNGSSATYLLNDVDAGEILEWNQIQIDSGIVTTENTGTWTGTIGGIPMTFEISASGNSASFTFSSSVSGGSGSGTENGTSADGTYNATSGSCSGEEGTWNVTISGTSMSGTATISTVGSGSDCGSVGDTGTISLSKS